LVYILPIYMTCQDSGLGCCSDSEVYVFDLTSDGKYIFLIYLEMQIIFNLNR
jgi:hypothetical protein